MRRFASFKTLSFAATFVFGVSIVALGVFAVPATAPATRPIAQAATHPFAGSPGSTWPVRPAAAPTTTVAPISAAPPSSLPALGPSTRFTMPPAETPPSAQTLASWQTPLLFRLDAMKVAAEESPLPADMRQAVASRVHSARTDVDAVAARFAVGAMRIIRARQAVDAIMARLQKDLSDLLGTRAGAFDARVDKIMGDIQLFADGDPARGRLIVQTAVKLSKPQETELDIILAASAQSLQAIDREGPPDALARRHEVGFSTRAAVRHMLAPEQLTAFDGPFEAFVASAQTRPSATAPTIAPATADASLSEAQAIALSRLEAMHYAVLESAYSPEVRLRLADRIASGSAQVRQAPATAPSGDASDDERVSQAYAAVLADAAETLHAQAADLIRRQNRIYDDVSELSGTGMRSFRAKLESLKLTESQRSQIDGILVDCIQQLKTIDPSLDPSHPTVGPAAKSERRRSAAFAARAAIRAVLTPEQQAAWDAIASK